MFFGKLGSAVVSSSLGALGESESETAFFRGFLAGAVDASSVAVSSADLSTPLAAPVDGAESAALRFDLADDDDVQGEAGVEAACSAAAAVRLDARRGVVLVGIAGAIVLAVVLNLSARKHC